MSSDRPVITVPLVEPCLSGNEGRYLKECLDTNWVSSGGPFINRFEAMIAEYVGSRHAVAVMNGTAALHVALLVAGVRPGDEVLAPTLTFIAPVNAIRYVGAEPVLIDAEPAHWQVDLARLAWFLNDGCETRDGRTINCATGRRVAAILPVHILGHPVDMAPLLELAEVHRLTVIEDATESLGARYRGRPVGTLGELACLSFNGNKLITTGGGGMILTDDDGLARRARHLTTQAKCDPAEYVHDEVGYNYRMTNLQAAVGCGQAERLAEFAAAKRRIAGSYGQGLASVPGLTLMAEATWAESAWWMYTVLVDSARFGTDSRGLRRRLRGQGIETRPLWQPLHRSLPYAAATRIGGEVADRIYRDALSLPCSVGLDEARQARVIDAIRNAALPAARFGA